jgi:diguanylate cyclase (GGDEF)-like protein
LPAEVLGILSDIHSLGRTLQAWGRSNDPGPVAEVVSHLAANAQTQLPVFKQAILRYRRFRAAATEQLAEKTFHIALTVTLEEEIRSLDALANHDAFLAIESKRLPRLKDYLPVQFIEASSVRLVPLLPRQYDEKFHILQAPSLFLPDLAHFRSRCEDRGTTLAVAFLDIDDFKQFNTGHTEPKVDRNLLPRFMQTIEAHLFQHGYAYRQGGDEYLALIPSVSKPLAIAFLDELRRKMSELAYPEISGKTTVSIGLCVVEPDCPLTDREILDRASQAKKHGKNNGKNCIATFDGPRFVSEELKVVGR